MSDAQLDRLDRVRATEVSQGITGTLSILRSDATPAQRTAWAETYMRCVLDRVADVDAAIDARVCTLLDIRWRVA